MKIRVAVLQSSLFSLLVLSLALPALAQQPDVTIESLYESKAWSPGVTIPLMIKTKTNQSIDVVSIEMRNDFGTCRIMKDLYRANVLLLRCKDEIENFSVKIGMLIEGKLYSADHGPLKIRYVFDNLRPVDKDPKPDELVVKGQKLYNTHCFGCHNPPSSVGNKTTAQIQSAISSVTQMKSLSTMSKADLDAITAYLKDK